MTNQPTPLPVPRVERRFPASERVTVNLPTGARTRIDELVHVTRTPRAALLRRMLLDSIHRMEIANRIAS